MKVPAEGSLNTLTPSSAPNKVKTPIHKIPIYKLYRRETEMVWAMRDSLPSAWASATVGSKSTAMELVMAEGNIIKGEGVIIGIKLENYDKRRSLRGFLILFLFFMQYGFVPNKTHEMSGFVERRKVIKNLSKLISMKRNE